MSRLSFHDLAVCGLYLYPSNSLSLTPTENSMKLIKIYDRYRGATIPINNVRLEVLLSEKQRVFLLTRIKLNEFHCVNGQNLIDCRKACLRHESTFH